MTPSSPAVPEPPPPTLAFPTIELVMRSYAPFLSFGDLGFGIGFEGDARGPSLSSSDTARVTSIALLDVAKKTVTFRAFSNESAWPALPFKHVSHSYWPAIIAHLQFTATAKPTVVGTLAVGVDGNLTIVMSHAGALPLIRGSPDIDLHTTFVLTFEGAGFASRRPWSVMPSRTQKRSCASMVKRTCFITSRREATQVGTARLSRG